MSKNYPTTKEELRPWLAEQIESMKPATSEPVQQQLLEIMLDMIPENGNIQTFCEGWMDARNGTVDQERLERGRRGEE